MNSMIRICALLLALLCLCTALFSCKEADGGTDTEAESLGGMPEYDTNALGNYVKPFTYTGLTVYADVGETRQEALWADIIADVEIISYPSEQVEYYVSQERAKYRYYAKRDGIEYEELIAALGVTEEAMYESARELVKDDLALQFIIVDANITLSDAEVSEHTDKYAERLAEIYGYDAEYIKTNMTEQIYDAMISDKTMEFLLGNNTVYTSMSK